LRRRPFLPASWNHEEEDIKEKIVSMAPKIAIAIEKYGVDSQAQKITDEHYDLAANYLTSHWHILDVVCAFVYLCVLCTAIHQSITEPA